VSGTTLTGCYGCKSKAASAACTIHASASFRSSIEDRSVQDKQPCRQALNRDFFD
jgi:hypothetical protein